jgi:hypothetical protein
LSGHRFRPASANRPSFSIGIPNREYHDVPLAIIDNRFWRLANTQGAGAQ